MAHTNSTPNYGLPQWIGTDKPTFLGDFNTAFSDIDTQMKANADAAASATSTANTAASAASTASTNATTALNTANSAASEAASATSAAASATATANSAATDAATALRASAANSIANLAPAYDPTLTYAVGDLVTYIDDNNTGKLYKCIVAVAAPEAFNINKWDDVTTSLVYQPIRKILVELTADGVKTWSDMLNELFPYIKNIDRLAEIYYIGANSTYTEKYIITTYDGTVARALNSVYVSPNMDNKFLNILESSSSRLEIETNVNTNTITVNNSSTNIVPSGAKMLVTSF